MIVFMYSFRYSQGGVGLSGSLFSDIIIGNIKPLSIFYRVGFVIVDIDEVSSKILFCFVIYRIIIPPNNCMKTVLLVKERGPIVVDRFRFHMNKRRVSYGPYVSIDHIINISSGSISSGDWRSISFHEKPCWV